MRENKFNLVQTIFVILGVMLVTFFFVPSPGTGNMDNMARWANTVNDYGLVTGYSIIADYPPISSVILLFVIRISEFLGIWLYTAIKLSIAFFLVLTSFVFWLWTRDVLLTLLLHISLLYNSVVLGHVDVYFAPFLILSLWALKERRLILFTCVFSIACLIKYQPLIIAPFIALYILNIKQITQWKQIDFRRILKHVVLPFIIIIVPTFAIFGLKPILIKSFYTGTHQGYLSANALNLNWIITHFLHVFNPDQFGPLIDGQATLIRSTPDQIRIGPQLVFYLVFIITVLVFFKRDKSFENLVLFSLLGYWAYFTLNTGVHENHLFIGMILSIVLFWLNKKHLLTMLTLILISNLNLIVFNGMDGKEIQFSRVISGVDMALLIAIFNVGVFVVFWIVNMMPEKKQLSQKSTRFEE